MDLVLPPPLSNSSNQRNLLVARHIPYQDKQDKVALHFLFVNVLMIGSCSVSSRLYCMRQSNSTTHLYVMESPFPPPSLVHLRRAIQQHAGSHVMAEPFCLTLSDRWFRNFAIVAAGFVSACSETHRRSTAEHALSESMVQLLM